MRMRWGPPHGDPVLSFSFSGGHETSLSTSCGNGGVVSAVAFADDAVMAATPA